MSVVDEAHNHCRHHLRWAQMHLRDLEEAVAQMWRARKAIGTGISVLKQHKRAQELLGDIRRDLADLQFALTRLAEGVDTDAPLN